jgi:hypothetical protein
VVIAAPKRSIHPALVELGEERARSVQNRVADAITRFAGSMWFAYLHIAWFSVWIALGVERYPYGLLTMIVSLEAIFLSTFVMTSQIEAGWSQNRDSLVVRFPRTASSGLAGYGDEAPRIASDSERPRPLGAPIDRTESRRLNLRDYDLARARIAAWKARERHSLSCVFVPSTSITCRSVLPSPARISIRRGLASGATGIWIVSTPCS